MDERGQVLFMHPSVFRTRAAEDSLLQVAMAVQPRRSKPVGSLPTQK
jgi:hypothetical protein